MAVISEVDQIFWIAKVFYRLKGWTPPKGFGPKHKNWIHFLRAHHWMRGLGTLYKGKYQTYLKAQFHYAPNKDRAKVFPTMLYSHKATQKWRWYLEWKKRRLGGIIPGILEYEEELSTQSMENAFEQSAWELEGYLQAGFTEEQAFRVFTSVFNPLFIIASTGALPKLEKNPDLFGPVVKATYLKAVQRPQVLHRMRALYGQCREEQHRRWYGDGGIAIRSLQCEDLYDGDGGPEEVPGPVGTGSDVPREVS